MLIGYARVTKRDDQGTAAQLNALRDVRCERVFVETARSGLWNRRVPQCMVDQLQPGRGVMIWKFARLPRSLKDQLRLLDMIDVAKIGFRSLTESIDATTAGRMMVQITCGFAKFVRLTSCEQMRTGHEHARIDGRIGGSRRKLDPRQRDKVLEGVLSGCKSAADMAPLFSVSEPTVSRVLAAARQQGNAA